MPAMSFDHRGSRDATSGRTAGARAVAEVGKHTLTSALEIQHKADSGAADAHVHAAAARGVSGASTALPHVDLIQRAFGRHDVGGVKAHVGGEAAEGAQAMGAKAFATGDRVAFAEAPDLHTAAHEAAHVVQQRGGVQLKGGVGQVGDAYEQHADAVADAVVAGSSAESLLDQMAPSGAGVSPAAAGASAGVQRKNLQQHGLDTGLTREGQGDLSGYVKPGNVYGEAIAGGSTRGEALAKAAEHSAALGQRIDAAKKGWTPDTQNFDDMKVGTLDPLLYKAKVTFGEAHTPEHLNLVFQHAKTKTGYVVRLEDSSNPATAGGATMYERSAGPQRETDKFSNEHDVTTGGNLLSQTSGAGEHNLDAYTKIAGEGARFQCVRRHATHLQNDTIFFTARPDDTSAVVGVEFQQLWKKWNQAFKKRYDVPDAEVAASIQTGKLADVALSTPRAKLGTKDYDLDTQASYTPHTM